MPSAGPSEMMVAPSSAPVDAVQEKQAPQPIANSPSIEASAAVAAAEVAELTQAVAAASLKDAAAAEAAVAAPAVSPSAAAATPVAPAPVVPVVPSSLDEPVKGENGELLNGGFKRGGAENDPVTGVYDEVELEDFDYDEDKDEYSYPCPCGDRFRIRKEDMLDGEDIARCASCSLLLRVIYDPEDLEDD